MEFGFLFFCTVLAALSYTLATLQTAAYFQRKMMPVRTLTEADQLALPLVQRDGPMILYVQDFE